MHSALTPPPADFRLHCGTDRLVLGPATGEIFPGMHLFVLRAGQYFPVIRWLVRRDPGTGWSCDSTRVRGPALLAVACLCPYGSPSGWWISEYRWARGSVY